MYALINKLILITGLLSGILIIPVTKADGSLFPWEIRDPALPYIAKVRADPQWGSAVIYNPDLCDQIGDACAFFRTHAYAHAFLNDLLLPPEKYAASLERKADCWAAKNIKEHEVVAVIQLFRDSEKTGQLPITGDPVERARIVRECADGKRIGY